MLGAAAAAAGGGGIKPCVSSFGGDQFKETSARERCGGNRVGKKLGHMGATGQCWAVKTRAEGRQWEQAWNRGTHAKSANWGGAACTVLTSNSGIMTAAGYMSAMQLQQRLKKLSVVVAAGSKTAATLMSPIKCVTQCCVVLCCVVLSLPCRSWRSSFFNYFYFTINIGALVSSSSSSSSTWVVFLTDEAAVAAAVAAAALWQLSQMMRQWQQQQWHQQ
jgi:dipeptide/tripeptide permease